jgi:hypothetical protein
MRGPSDSFCNSPGGEPEIKIFRLQKGIRKHAAGCVVGA